MDERAAFVRRICEEPDCDTVRLAFADYLQENGEGERAEFIRVQCELANVTAKAHRHEKKCPHYGLYRTKLKPFFTERVTCPKCRPRWLRFRDAELWSQAGDWFLPPGDLVCRRAPGKRRVHWGEFGQDLAETILCEVSRGFVSEIHLPTAAFLEHAKAIFAAHPVVRVVLPERLAIGDGWDTPNEAWTWLRAEPGEDRRRMARWEVPLEIEAARTGLGGWFASRESAIKALSDACVAFGRELAKLPPLPQKVSA